MFRLPLRDGLKAEPVISLISCNLCSIPFTLSLLGAFNHLFSVFPIHIRR